MITFEKKEENINSPSQTRLTKLLNISKNAKELLEESYKKVLARKNDKLCEKLIEFFEKKH